MAHCLNIFLSTLGLLAVGGSVEHMCYIEFMFFRFVLNVVYCTCY